MKLPRRKLLQGVLTVTASYFTATSAAETKRLISEYFLYHRWKQCWLSGANSSLRTVFMKRAGNECYCPLAITVSVYRYVTSSAKRKESVLRERFQKLKPSEISYTDVPSHMAALLHIPIVHIYGMWVSSVGGNAVVLCVQQWSHQSAKELLVIAILEPQVAFLRKFLYRFAVPTKCIEKIH